VAGYLRQTSWTARTVPHLVPYPGTELGSHFICYLHERTILRKFSENVSCINQKKKWEMYNRHITVIVNLIGWHQEAG
jgi:hypothetical protein